MPILSEWAVIRFNVTPTESLLFVIILTLFISSLKAYDLNNKWQNMQCSTEVSFSLSHWPVLQNILLNIFNTVKYLTQMARQWLWEILTEQPAGLRAALSHGNALKNETACWLMCFKIDDPF